MVKYNQVALIFYAVVDNNSSDICWPTDKAMEVLKSFNLNFVKIESVGLFQDYDSLCNGIYKTYRDVAKSKIVDEEEGSVLYLIKRSKNGPSQDKVLSLAKLKTLEYRIFRKMREKLRGFFKHQDQKNAKPAEEIIKAFN